VLTRALAQGEVLKADDVALMRRPKSEFAANVLTNPAQAAGLGARRALRAGQVLRDGDLQRPELVARNETVTITFEVPGIVLTMRGQAIEAGALGDLVNVLNVQSKRTIQATVTGHGRVSVGARPRDWRRTHPQQHTCTRRVRVMPMKFNNMSRAANAALLPSFLWGASGTGRCVSRAALVAALAAFAGGCSSLDRIRFLGEKPPLAAIENPTTQAGYKPVQMPMPAPQPAVYNPNSLWRNGSRAFFKDQRAHQIGDILTVMVNITDKAAIDNETQRSRTNKEDSGITDFIGSKTLGAGGAKAVLPGRILTADSTALSEGKGSVNRQEALQTTSPRW